MSAVAELDGTAASCPGGGRYGRGTAEAMACDGTECMSKVWTFEALGTCDAIDYVVGVDLHTCRDRKLVLARSVGVFRGPWWCDGGVTLWAVVATFGLV